jgi:pyruvate/2-oxoglutarate dehydrogenase complex dihydrolipoamide acyltransferase (E2) component
MRRYREETGERVSFFAWMVKCIAQAVSEHKEVNAYRGRRGVVVFDDVDVSVIVEKTVAGAKILVPCVVRQHRPRLWLRFRARCEPLRRRT